MRAVIVGIVRVVVVAGAIPASHIVDIAIAVVIHAIAWNLAGVAEDVGGQIGMVPIDARIGDAHDDVRVAEGGVPGFDVFHHGVMVLVHEFRVVGHELQSVGDRPVGFGVNHVDQALQFADCRVGVDPLGQQHMRHRHLGPAGFGEVEDHVNIGGQLVQSSPPGLLRKVRLNVVDAIGRTQAQHDFAGNAYRGERLGIPTEIAGQEDPRFQLFDFNGLQRASSLVLATGGSASFGTCSAGAGPKLHRGGPDLSVGRLELRWFLLPRRQGAVTDEK